MQGEIEHIKNAINSLRSSLFTLEDKYYSVKHIMALTMVDVEVRNAAKLTSTMRCFICGATSKEFNDLTIKKKMLMSIQFLLVNLFCTPGFVCSKAYYTFHISSL